METQKSSVAAVNQDSDVSCLIPWCSVRARSGMYDVVTRSGRPVHEWYEFGVNTLYPVRAVVERDGVLVIVEFSRIGGFLDGEGAKEDEDDLMLKAKQPVECVNGYFIAASLTAEDADGFENLYIADPSSSSWCYMITLDTAAKDLQAMTFNRGLVYLTRADAAAKAMAMTGLDPHAAAAGIL